MPVHRLTKVLPATQQKPKVMQWPAPALILTHPNGAHRSKICTALALINQKDHHAAGLGSPSCGVCGAQYVTVKVHGANGLPSLTWVGLTLMGLALVDLPLVGLTNTRVKETRALKLLGTSIRLGRPRQQTPQM